MRKYNLPIFIPHRGCPHDCAFCSQKKITGIETDVTPDEVRSLIKTFLSTINEDKSSVEAAFFGGSFTGMDLSVQEGFLKVASEFYPQISGVRLSTRPDYINEDVLTLLKKYGVTTVELGVQSSNDTVLEMNDRGHTFDDVIKASEDIRGAGISLGHQIMLGMYGSDPEKDMLTVEDVVALKPSCVRIYPVITLRDTKIHKYFEEGKYKPYTIEQAAQLAKWAVARFREQKIEVIRIGLHSSEDLESDASIVAGPYHPAFGELVESLIYRDKMEKQYNGKDKIFEFVCRKGDISKAVGHKKMNKLYFKEKYKAELKVIEVQ